MINPRLASAASQPFPAGAGAWHSQGRSFLHDLKQLSGKLLREGDAEAFGFEVAAGQGKTAGINNADRRVASNLMAGYFTVIPG